MFWLWGFYTLGCVFCSGWPSIPWLPGPGVSHLLENSPLIQYKVSRLSKGAAGLMLLRGDNVFASLNSRAPLVDTLNTWLPLVEMGCPGEGHIRESFMMDLCSLWHVGMKCPHSCWIKLLRFPYSDWPVSLSTACYMSRQGFALSIHVPFIVFRMIVFIRPHEGTLPYMGIVIAIRLGGLGRGFIMLWHFLIGRLFLLSSHVTGHLLPGM